MPLLFANPQTSPVEAQLIHIPASFDPDQIVLNEHFDQGLYFVAHLNIK